MTAPHTIHRLDNDTEKAPRGWPYAYEVRDALGRYVAYFGFDPDRYGPEAGERALAAAERARNEADWHTTLPVGRRKGPWLESARTVRSRAADALSYVWRDEGGQPRADLYTPEDRDIITDLEAVVARLDDWKRTGRTPKYPGGK